MTDDSGTRFETACMNYLREVNQTLAVTRLAKAGKLDEGDLAVNLQEIPRYVFVVECKARRSKTNQLTLGSYMAEAITEAEHYTDAHGLLYPALPTVFLKRPGKSIGDCFAILRLQDFGRL